MHNHILTKFEVKHEIQFTNCSFLGCICINILIILDLLFYMISGIDEEAKLFSKRTTTMPFLSEKELTVSNMFYFEMLHINPIKANISFVTTPKIINPNVYFFILFHYNIHACFLYLTHTRTTRNSLE
jgi:hypothetical protein